jgi:hypothetical protein
MQKIKRKAALTLIEVCIALGLMAIIVTTLFSSLLQTIQVSKSLDRVKETALKSSFFYDRLLHIFSHANSSTVLVDKEEKEKISFIFENGLDPAFIFSGKTKGLIYLDQHQNLILEISSKDGKSVRSEIILSDVQEINWDSGAPFFLSLGIKFSKDVRREFVFFFSDRPLNKEGYPV